MKIITDRTKLTKELPVKEMSVDKVKEVTEIMERELDLNPAIGLSANQLGLKDRVCIIDVIEKLVLINPVIIEMSDKTVAYAEQCLSIPRSMKNPVKTIRHTSLKIKTDNLGMVEFNSDKDTWKDQDEFFGDKGLLECVCAQHEIDHLNGILITHSSRRYSTTLVRSKKIGRNEKVMVELPNGNTEFMKYKKALPMLQYGCKIL